MFRKDLKVLQLIPAVGWSALFSTDDFTDYVSSPLIAWALVQRDGPGTDLVGLCIVSDLCGEIDVADEHDYFFGYASPDGNPFAGEALKEALELIRDYVEGDRREKAREESPRAEPDESAQDD